MDKCNLIIIPVHGSTVSIPTIYYNKILKQRIAINSAGVVKFGSEIKLDDLLQVNMPSGASTYEYEWTPGDKIGETVKDFWLNHQLIKPLHVDNKNMTQHLFTLKIPHEIDIASYKRVKNQLAVANYIGQLEGDEEELRNISFFFNANPTGKTAQKIFTELIDFKNGILMRDEIIDNFFTLYSKDNSDAQMKVVVNKAISLNIITFRDGIYWFNNISIGSNIERLIMYCKENREIYNQQIVPYVNRSDVYVPSKKEVKQVGNMAADNPIAIGVEKEERRTRAKELKLRNWHNINKETFDRMEKLAESVYSEAESLGIDWRSSEFKWVDEVEDQIEIAKKKLASQV